MNRWEGIGGLTRDAEFRFTEGGVAVWSATIAVNGARWDGASRKQVVTTQYIRCVAFGWAAEEFAQWALLQGEEIHVVGQLEQADVAKRDGTSERKTSVRVITLQPTRRHPTRAANSSPAEPPF